MDKEERKRIARRFIEDDKPCAVAREGRVHKLPEDYKVIEVDKLSLDKKE